MTRFLALSALGLALAGCAAAPPGPSAVCDGRHRRPANPNGSVLTPLAAPVPGKATADPASQAPCGGRP